MAVNKYGNDFKNNIMWNKEYPFIPEVTNDYGFTIHEGDIVDYYCKYQKKYFAFYVAKIYNKDFVWCRYQRYEGNRKVDVLTEHVCTANELTPYISNVEIPRIEDLDNQGVWNHLEDFLGHVYSDLYGDELALPDDWHFDEDKFTAKRLEEVAKLKSKY